MIMNQLKQTLNAIVGQLQSSLQNKPFSGKSCAEICDTIQKAAKSLGYAFSCMDSKLYCYHGKMWVEIPKSYLTQFLIYSNCSILNDGIAGKERKRIEDLVRQFPYSMMGLFPTQAPDKINFNNGTLDLTKMQLVPHQWTDYFRYALPFDYDPTAQCPKFKSYLDRVMPDPSGQLVLAEFLGWIFASSLKLEKVLFLYGKGCNGKSVFLDIAHALIGSGNVSHESISDLCYGEHSANHRSNIIGKLLNTCSDVSPEAFQGDVFKRMASGEPISAKVLYEDVITTTDYPKMIFCMNELPKTNDRSNGYYRRFLIAPFNVEIPKKQIDPKLASTIIAHELPGIMNWVLEGRSRLVQQNGFSPCALFDKALEDYKNKDTKSKKSLIIWPNFNK